MLKPSLSTRTKLALYINSIPFEHQRTDFSQILRDAGVYHTMWRIVQLARMAFFTLGDVDRSELWNNDYKAPLKDLMKSLADDSEECDLHVQCTGGDVKIQFSANPNFQDLVEMLTVNELDRAHRGVERGDPRIIEQFDQAMLELIYEVGLTASSKNRFFNHFLRDVMVLVSPRFAWMAEYVQKPVPVPMGVVADESYASATCAFLPDWITADKGVHQVLPEFHIDAAVFDDAVQGTWNDQAPISQLVFLVRQALGGNSEGRTKNCFETLIGSLDQFTTLLLAQAMVRKSAEAAMAEPSPAAAEPQEAPAVKGMEPGAQGDLQRALNDLSWLFAEEDPVQNDILGNPPPEKWADAEAIIHAALRKAIRRATNKGTGPLDLNAMISRVTIALIGPAPAKGATSFDPGSAQDTTPPLLRRSEEASDPAADQRDSIARQRREQRLNDVLEACKQKVVFFGEMEEVTSENVASFALLVGELDFTNADVELLADRFWDSRYGDDSRRKDLALSRLTKAVAGFNCETVRYAATEAVRRHHGEGDRTSMVDSVVEAMENRLARCASTGPAEGVNLLPLALELTPKPEKEKTPQPASKEELFAALPQAVQDHFNQYGSLEVRAFAMNGHISPTGALDYFQELAKHYPGDFVTDALDLTEEELDIVDRGIAAYMGPASEIFEPELFRRKFFEYLISNYLVVKSQGGMEEAYPTVLWEFIALNEATLSVAARRAVIKRLFFGEALPTYEIDQVLKNRSLNYVLDFWAPQVVGKAHGELLARMDRSFRALQKAYNALNASDEEADVDLDETLLRGLRAGTDQGDEWLPSLRNKFKEVAVVRYGPGGDLGEFNLETLIPLMKEVCKNLAAK